MDLDPQGTCHLVGCEGKGKHAPHGIGTPTPESYERQTNPNCLGFPVVRPYTTDSVVVVCSLGGAWSRTVQGSISPLEMSQFVDRHKATCPNRRPR